MTHLLLTLTGAVLAVISLPLVLELLLVTAAQLLPFKARIGPVAALPDFALAIIVPAHNEELLVARSVRSLHASANPNVRIFVVAHNSTDATAARAQEAGADAVMVVDADSIVSANTIAVVEQAFAAGARVLQCRYEMVSTTEKSSTRLSALAFRGFNVIRPQGRERLGFSAGILGNGFAILRPVLEAIPYDAFSVVEDLEYHLHLVMAGERVRYLDEALISADFPESRAGEAVQRSRWEGGRLLTARTWALPIVAKVLRGRLRLLEPLCDLTGLPLAYGVFTLLIALLLPLGWLRWYAVVSLAIVLAHVLAAAWAGPDFLGTMKLLVLAPYYILRKLAMIPGVLRGSSAKADWVRTERDNTL